jgi:hypothetical protein
MSVDRVWYWIAQLVDPREHDKTWASMFTSLAFMPETLILEPPDLCFFRASGRVPSQCVVVGGARGTDTLDQTTLALQRVEDAVAALTLVRAAKYDVALLHYGLDQLPEEFLPGNETFRHAEFGRSPPLTEEAATQVKDWYTALRGARAERNANAAIENGVAISIEALTTHTKFKYVLLHTAFEELCDLHGGFHKAKSVLGFSVEDRRRIERARRPVAHGGANGKVQDPRPSSTLQAEATSAFKRILLRSLERLHTTPSHGDAQ